METSRTMSHCAGDYRGRTEGRQRRRGRPVDGPAFRVRRRSVRSHRRQRPRREMRPGTGSAMYYIWLARGEPGDAAPPIGATAEGRKRGEFFSANLAPSPNAAIRGPIGVLQAFSRIDYGRICNGGPITMELSDLSFRDEDSIAKCALLVRTFAQLGCQQLQLNALNAETLLDAKRHPGATPEPHRARLGLERLLLRARARVPGSRGSAPVIRTIGTRDFRSDPRDTRVHHSRRPGSAHDGIPERLPAPLRLVP